MKFNNFNKSHNYYEFYGDKNADNLIIAYGITSRVIYDLVDKHPKKFAMFRPITLFPILEKTLKRFTSDFEKVYCLEMNDGQYVKALRDKLVIDIEGISVGLGGEIKLDEIEKKLEF